MSPTELIAQYRKDLAARRQALLEQFPKFLPHEQYLAKCGQFMQIEQDAETLNALIQKANRAFATGEDD